MRFEELAGVPSLFLRFLSQAPGKVPCPSRILRRARKHNPPSLGGFPPFPLKEAESMGAALLRVEEGEKQICARFALSF
jgi:hypothetical protein